MLEAVQRSHFAADVFVARRELVTEERQDREIDFVGAVRVGRMDARLDVGGIVVQQIEHEWLSCSLAPMMRALSGTWV